MAPNENVQRTVKSVPFLLKLFPDLKYAVLHTAPRGLFDSGSAIDESGFYNDSDPSATSFVESEGNELASDSHDLDNPSSSIADINEDRKGKFMLSSFKVQFCL
ncbi:hypothetical protein MA16_Dca025780 [Dendrobium catenatum]|uniref:Uncharacterized protein n=1 Tax=Dendrobium catenatum TaxID=906689 RepID=A0A2I0XEL3_9ASPA|nr:hypothetical protein MA16_Dca025780 [Dendrobium catenatum]